MEKLSCIRCGYAYEAKCNAANMIFLCPKCFNYINCICEYGFGPIVPCSILLGEKQIAEIVYKGRTDYRLISEELGIDKDLTKGYEKLGAYDEAVGIVTELLEGNSGAKMEELTVEAILGSLGYGSQEEYQRILNNLWETAPDEYEPLLLELESRKYKDAMIYLMHRSPSFSSGGKVAVFGKYLMKRLKTLYHQIPLEEFCDLAYSVWGKLPETINMAEPFYTLNYAGDSLSWGDEFGCRERYEKMFSYYD